MDGAIAFVWNWVDANSMTDGSGNPNANETNYDNLFVKPANAYQ